MEPQNHDYINEIAEYFSKFWTWFFYIIVGLMGKFGMMLQDGKKRSGWQYVGSAFVSIFIGFLTSMYCIYAGATQKGALLVPVATLIADRLVIVLFNINYTPIVEAIMGAKKKK